MKNITFLDEVHNKSEFLNLLKDEEASKCISHSLFNKEMLEVALNSVTSFSGEQEKLFLDFIHYVDRRQVSQASTSKNMKNKMMTILSGSIYIGNFYDKIRHYEFDHLMSISAFSFLDYLDEYSLYLDVFTEELFKVYQEKTKDYMFYFSFNELAMILHSDGLSNEEIVKYIKNKDSKEILWEVGTYVDEIAEKEGFSI